MLQYETVEQAVATRKALHGKRWPVSNPKLLGVEFRSMDEVLRLDFCLTIACRILSASVVWICGIYRLLTVVYIS